MRQGFPYGYFLRHPVDTRTAAGAAADALRGPLGATPPSAPLKMIR
eukprot:COSAG01_NODE_53894_length_336_cov_0.489451_1_plen_45_part_10